VDIQRHRFVPVWTLRKHPTGGQGTTRAAASRGNGRQARIGGSPSRNLAWRRDARAAFRLERAHCL